MRGKTKTSPQRTEGTDNEHAREGEVELKSLACNRNYNNSAPLWLEFFVFVFHNYTELLS